MALLDPGDQRKLPDSIVCSGIRKHGCGPKTQTGIVLKPAAWGSTAVLAGMDGSLELVGKGEFEY